MIFVHSLTSNLCKMVSLGINIVCKNHTSSVFERLLFLTSERCLTIKYSTATLHVAIRTSIDSFSDFNTQTMGIFVLACHFNNSSF